MIPQMSSGDLGSAEYDYVARGSTAEDVERDLMRRAAYDHGALSAAMSPNQIEEAWQRVDEHLSGLAGRACLNTANKLPETP